MKHRGFAKKKLLLLAGLTFIGLGVSACGGDDNKGGQLGSCEGSDLPLAGSCDFGDGTCIEARGMLGSNLDKGCDDFGGTFSALGCPAPTKSSGGCVTKKTGGVSIAYSGVDDAAYYRTDCEDNDGCYFGG